MNRDVFQLNAEIEETHWWFAARREIICGLVFEIMPPGKDRMVIDVGCGTGANIARLAPHYEVVGVDVTEDAIGFAKERFPDVRFECRDAIEFIATIGDRQMAILLNDVLEHVDLVDSFFRGIFEVAPAGTYFVITVPANPDLWSPHDVSHGHYRRYTRETLEDHWKGLPVDVLLCSYYNTRLYPVVRGLRALTSLIGKSYGGADTDLSVPPRYINSILLLIFGGELARLKAALKSNSPGYNRGVSLIAVLRKSAGVVA